MISAPVSWPGLRCVAPLYGISLRNYTPQPPKGGVNYRLKAEGDVVDD